MNERNISLPYLKNKTSVSTEVLFTYCLRSIYLPTTALLHSLQHGLHLTI